MGMRESYTVANTRYSKSLAVLKELTAHATEAAAKAVKLSNQVSIAARGIES